MKILYTTGSLEPSAGGPARSVPQLARAVARLGHEVALWSPLGGNAEGVEIDTLYILQGSFEEALEEFGVPDIVHDNGVWLACNREVARVCTQRHIKRVVAPRGMLEPWALNHKKWKKKLAWYTYQKRNLQSAAGLHATAESEAAQLRRLGLKLPITVAGNGVDLPELPASNLAAVRPKTALFLSRVHPKKGLPLLVEAWQRLQPEGWRVRVVGPDEGGHRAEVQSMVAKAGLSDSWFFEESLEGEDKWQAMREAALFVLPTYSENFGIVVAEALASETPVLTTTGTPWQALETHGCGWCCEPTVEGVSQALEQALSEQSNYKAMGRNGRSWVAKDFLWANIAGEIANFYKELT